MPYSGFASYLAGFHALALVVWYLLLPGPATPAVDDNDVCCDHQERSPRVSGARFLCRIMNRAFADDGLCFYATVENRETAIQIVRGYDLDCSRREEGPEEGEFREAVKRLCPTPTGRRPARSDLCSAAGPAGAETGPPGRSSASASRAEIDTRPFLEGAARRKAALRAPVRQHGVMELRQIDAMDRLGSWGLRYPGAREGSPPPGGGRTRWILAVIPMPELQPAGPG